MDFSSLINIEIELKTSKAMDFEERKLVELDSNCIYEP